MFRSHRIRMGAALAGGLTGLLLAGTALAVPRTLAELPEELRPYFVEVTSPAGSETTLRGIDAFNVSATDGTYEDRVELTWTAAPELDVYFVITRDDEELTWLSAQDSVFVDTEVDPGRIHHYRVIMNHLEIGFVHVGEDFGHKGFFAPGNLVASDYDDLTGVSLSWEDRSAIEHGYIIRRDGNTIVDTLDADTSIYHDMTADPLQVHEYCVTAYRTDGAETIPVASLGVAAPLRAVAVEDWPQLFGQPSPGVFAFTVDDARFRIFDVTDPSNPVPRGQLPLPGVDVAQGASQFAYIADGAGTVSVIYAYDVDSPNLAQTIPTEGDALGVVALEPPDYWQGTSYIAVADGTAGVSIYGVFKGAYLVQSIDTPGTAVGIAYAENYLYVADAEAGLTIIDATVPGDLEVVGNLGLFDIVDVAAYGDRVIAIDGGGFATVVDVRNPAQPETVITSPGPVEGAIMWGTRAYLRGAGPDIQVIETTGAIEVDTIPTTYPVRDFSILDDRLHVATGDGVSSGELLVFDVPFEVTSGSSCDLGVEGTIERPTDVSATYGRYLDRTVVTWTDNATGETGYRVATIDGDVQVDLPADTEAFVDSTSGAGIEREYRVSVLDAEGDPVPADAATGIYGPETLPSPTDVIASEIDDSDEYVRLTWTDTDDEDYYVIYRRHIEGPAADSLATVPADVTTFDDTTVPSQVTHEYYVVARTDPGGYSSPSETTYGSRDDILPPGSVTATDGDHETHVTITWENRSAKTVLFRIHRDGVPIQTVTGTATTAEDPLGAPGVEYTYRVDAVTASGIASGASDQGSRVLIAPTNVSAEDAIAEDRVRITWQDASGAETGYRIYRDDVEVGAVAANRTSYTDLTAVPGTTHTYGVEAHDALGESERPTDTGHRIILAPENLQASDGISETTVVLTWDDRSGVETGYEVRRDGQLVSGALPANTTTYTVGGGTLGVPHTYSVTAFDPHGGSESAEDEGYRDILPPGSLSASTTYSDRIVLSWTDDSGLNTEYQIFRDDVLLTTVSGTTTYYEDDLIDVDVEHEYCVVSYHSGSGATATACATGVRPSSTLAFGSMPITASSGDYDNRVRLEWTSSAPGGLAGFEVYRDGQKIETLDATASSYNDFDAVPGATHRYGVAGVNSSGTFLESGGDPGWIPADGAINGRVTTRAGSPVDGVDVCLSPSPGQALSFDGFSSRVEALDESSELTDAFTVEFWMKSNGLATNETFFSYATADHSDEIVVYRQASGAHFKVRIQGATASYNLSPWDGDWHHIAIAWDGDAAGANLEVYLDGELEGQTALQDQVTLNAPGNFMLGQNHAFGGAFAASGYRGLLDEVRVWNVARSEEEIQADLYRSLTGTEDGLVHFWPLGEGSGTGTADLVAGVDGALEDGVDWTEDTAPISVCGTTDLDGNYALAGIRYGAATDFRVTPSGEGRAFDPGFTTITLDTDSPVANEVNFNDVSAFTLSGLIAYELAPSCGQADVPLYIDDILAGTTRADGSFALSVQPGAHVLEPRLDGHTFSPASYALTVSEGMAGLDFDNTTTRILTGRIGGGCDASIGEWSFDLASENGCFATTIQADGQFEMQLPPLFLIATVDQLTGTVPPPLDEAAILQFFQTLGSVNVDLTTADQEVDLVYKAPLTVEITGFPTACGDFYDPESGATSVAAPVIAQLADVALTIKVFENYGPVQCPVDSGTVTIYDEIKDIADSPVTVTIADGVGSYTTTANTPNVTPGRRDAQGNDRSFQKAITFAAEVPGQPAVVQTRWALVTGDRPRTGTFVTATTEEIPLLILRDPPGDGSVSTMAQEISYTYSLGGMLLRSITGSFETAVKAGFQFEAGGLFFSTESDTELETTRGFEIGASASVEGNLEFTVTTTEEFSTSDEQVFVGPDADLILGVAMNLLFAKTDVLAVDPATCQIQRSQTVRFGADADKPFETVYLYTTSHIANVVMPQLTELAALEPSRDYELLSYRKNWQDHLDLNDSLRQQALQNPVANRTFSAGAEYGYSHTTTEVESFGWEVNVYTEDSFSTQIGFEIAGTGATTTLAATLRSEVSLGGGGEFEESITVGYELSDDDPGDSFTFDVGNDPLYGTPVFGIRSGRSSCPLEIGTQERDAVSMLVEPPARTGVPEDGAAEFVLSITNDSPSDDAREYQVRAIQTSNPGGAVIKVNGSILDGSVSFFIDPGQTQNATLTVERGPSQYFYEDLQLQVVAPCEYELWEAGGTLAVADTIDVDVSFTSPCSNISLVSPSSGWSFDLAGSVASTDTLSLLLDGFELAISESDSIQSVGAEYRRVGTDTWIIIDEVAASDVSVYPPGHALEGEPQSVSIDWNVAGVVDGQYEVRAFTRCDGGRVPSFSATGRIDRQVPGLFGDPFPTDLVFSLGDRMGFRFDEPIDCETVNGTSMMLEIVEAGGDTPVAITTSCSGNTILITPTNPTIANLEGKTLRATAGATLQDLAGNPLGTDETWTFTVARSAFAWREASLFEEVPYRAGGSVDGVLVNGLDEDRDYELRNVGEWLIPEASSGTVVAGQESVVSFAISDTLSVGTSYVDTLEAVSPSLADPQIVTQLIVRVDVGCVTPAWEMSAGGFEYSMTAVIELGVDGQISDDEDDLVAAFVGGELRGLASPTHVPGLDRHLVFMNIFSNRAAGENVRFRIYDDSDCRLYPSADNFLRFESDRRHGTPESPIVLTAVETLPADVQAIPVGPGWTWFSLNLLDDLDMTVVSILGDLNAEEGDQIKSQAGFAQYDDDLGWTGSLTDLDVTRSFAIDVSESGTILHVGDPTQADIPIAIVDGWNWVGYPPATPQDVNTALSNLVAQDGDVIKSQYGFAEYVGSLDEWVGTLTAMEPGLGYKLHVADALLSSGWLTYPIPAAPPARSTARPISGWGGKATSRLASASSMKAAEELGDAARLDGANRPDWRLTVGRQYNMTLVAEVSVDNAVVESEGGVIGAFVGDELRGVGEVQYVYGLGAHAAFVMVHSNAIGGEEVTFRYYDANADEVLDVGETVTFEADLALGSLDQPVALRATSQGPSAPTVPTAFSLSPLAPNPARGGAVRIQWAVPAESRVVVRLYDVSGREVGTMVDEVLPAGWYSREIDTARLSSGVYFTRMQASGFSEMRKLLLLK